MERIWRFRTEEDGRSFSFSRQSLPKLFRQPAPHGHICAHCGPASRRISGPTRSSRIASPVNRELLGIDDQEHACNFVVLVERQTQHAFEIIAGKDQHPWLVSNGTLLVGTRVSPPVTLRSVRKMIATAQGIMPRPMDDRVLRRRTSTSCLALPGPPVRAPH